MAVVVREIVDAYLSTHPGGVKLWTIMTSNRDGSLWPYFIPPEGLENFAVEYGLDPDDFDGLLRFAMLDCHVNQPTGAHDDPAMRAGHTHRGRPVWLDNASSTEQARAAHLERVDWVERNLVRIVQPVKGQRRRVRALDLDPDNDVEVDPYERLQALKATYWPDRDRMEQKRAFLRMALGREI